MNWDEHLTLIEHCVNEYANYLTIIGNTGSNSTREALESTRIGFKAGMHAAL
jgi:4-hydroxy-tetrahydrodipicolinate synthase